MVARSNLKTAKTVNHQFENVAREIFSLDPVVGAAGFETAADHLESGLLLPLEIGPEVAGRSHLTRDERRDIGTCGKMG
jgi:hypothetical protein